MKFFKPTRKLILLLFGVLFILVNFVFLWLHLTETRIINKFNKDHALVFSDQSKKNAVVFSDTIRANFETNVKKWTEISADYGKMPFFRYSVVELLKVKETQCGGGARVLCRLLLESGYDATRVVLFTRNFGAMGHVIVSVVIQGKEYWIDTLNSPADLNELFEKYDINSYTVKIIPYKQRYNPKYIDVKYSTDSVINKFQHNYIAYSYEALPFSKLLNSIGVDVYVLNLKRPPYVFSYLAESVYLLYSITFSIIFILMLLAGYLICFAVRFSMSLRVKLSLIKGTP